jgi:hypothetical protein
MPVRIDADLVQETGPARLADAVPDLAGDERFRAAVTTAQVGECLLKVTEIHRAMRFDRARAKRVDPSLFTPGLFEGSSRVRGAVTVLLEPAG